MQKNLNWRVNLWHQTIAIDCTDIMIMNIVDNQYIKDDSQWSDKDVFCCLCYENISYQLKSYQWLCHLDFQKQN